ncbi:MAG: hypothetical protein HKL92_07380 [Candidatus Eremiobacteraeota bacterium]|nr:hypothetical protein [Candidatus Eremiobacteraeota bacterium]NNM93147.1 hypothetical protein [Candidatus Eremiobacteraeota bacterium]
MLSTCRALALAVTLIATIGAAAAPKPASLCDGGLLAILNRPTIGFSTCAVAPRQVVGEFGIQNTLDAAGSNISLGQGFLRYGLGHGFEADINGPNVIAGSTVPFAGLQDLGLGLKWQFLDRPTLGGAFDLIQNLPTARTGVTLGAPSTTLNLDLATALGSRSGLGITLAAIDTSGFRTGGARQRYVAFQPSMALTNLITPRLQVYLEGVALSRTAPDAPGAFTVDGGFQYAATPKLELDIEAAQSTSDGIASHYFGLGFGIAL